MTGEHQWLLPPAEGRVRLAEVRAFAESEGRARLLQEAVALEQKLFRKPSA